MSTNILKSTLMLGVAMIWPALSQAEQAIYGVQVEQLEYRFADGEDSYVWDFDALYGSDELKLVWRSEGEVSDTSGEIEDLEHQLRLQMPVSTFFDAVVGLQASTPQDGPDRYNAVLGVKGLAPQWFEIDADLYLSDNPFFRFEAEYEALISQRVTLIPSIELDVPISDDDALNRAAGAPVLEVGARLSYDLVDRSFSPYIGVNYEKAYGGTANRMSANGEETESFSIVVGTRLMF